MGRRRIEKNECLKEMVLDSFYAFNSLINAGYDFTTSYKLAKEMTVYGGLKMLDELIFGNMELN